MLYRLSYAGIIRFAKSNCKMQNAKCKAQTVSGMLPFRRGKSSEASKTKRRDGCSLSRHEDTKAGVAEVSGQISEASRGRGPRGTSDQFAVCSSGSRPRRLAVGLRPLPFPLSPLHLGGSIPVFGTLPDEGELRRAAAERGLEHGEVQPRSGRFARFVSAVPESADLFQ